jgi:hypothetical protein
MKIKFSKSVVQNDVCGFHYTEKRIKISNGKRKAYLQIHSNLESVPEKDMLYHLLIDARALSLVKSHKMFSRFFGYDFGVGETVYNSIKHNMKGLKFVLGDDYTKLMEVEHELDLEEKIKEITQ